jgi:hypothetical protein
MTDGDEILHRHVMVTAFQGQELAHRGFANWKFNEN